MYLLGHVVQSLISPSPPFMRDEPGRFQANLHAHAQDAAISSLLQNRGKTYMTKHYEPRTPSDRLYQLQGETTEQTSKILPTIMDRSVDTFEQTKRFLSSSFRNWKKKFCR